MKKLALSFLLIKAIYVNAQTDTVNISFVSKYYFEHPFLPYSAYTSVFNKNDAPYLYSACRELGIVTFDITNINTPVPVDTITTASFNGLLPTNLKQTGNYLYCSLGGYDGFFPQKPGLAILDLSNPSSPVITDIWDTIIFDEGASIAISDGEFAYLGAMDEGVILLNVNDKYNIKFISSILPDPDFPEVAGIFSTPNARGLALYGSDKLMVANDAGGLRMLDISDKENPLEIGKYVNTGIEDIAQSAYNNIAIVDHYAYIPVDMCGLDVVDITDEEMETIYWYNPWDCDSSNWIGRPGHTNEIEVVGDSLLFVSGGDSELLIFDITDRENPVLVGQYINEFDSIVAWGVDVNNNYVSLALVNNEIVQIPYYSDVGGITILQWEAIPNVGILDAEQYLFAIEISPNPADNSIQIESNSVWIYCEVIDLNGRTVNQLEYTNSIDCRNMENGFYILRFYDLRSQPIGIGKFIVQHY